MTEERFVKVLSLMVEKVIQQVGPERSSDESRFVADGIADAAWNCVILLMRQKFSGGEQVVLEELGIFEEGKSAWTFEPAASLLKATSLNLSPKGRLDYLQERTLFYLHQGTELLKMIPRDDETELRAFFDEVASIKGILESILSGMAQEPEEVNVIMKRVQVLQTRMESVQSESEPAGT